MVVVVVVAVVVVVPRGVSKENKLEWTAAIAAGVGWLA